MTPTWRRRLAVLFPTCLALVAGPLAASAAGDPVAGAAQYDATCGGCHSLDANRVGPMHRGVVGRRPGAVAGYDYSPAVRRLGGVWTAARLDAWLQGPQAVAPGAKMFLSVSDPAKRTNIIAYLASVSPAAQAAPAPKRR
jgi:cytochrome c